LQTAIRIRIGVGRNTRINPVAKVRIRTVGVDWRIKTRTRTDIAHIGGTGCVVVAVGIIVTSFTHVRRLDADRAVWRAARAAARIAATHAAVRAGVSVGGITDVTCRLTCIRTGAELSVVAQCVQV